MISDRKIVLLTSLLKLDKILSVLNIHNVFTRLRGIHILHHGESSFNVWLLVLLPGTYLWHQLVSSSGVFLYICLFQYYVNRYI